MAQEQPLSPRKKFWFTLVLIGLAILLPFLLLEAGIRLTQPYVDLLALTGRKIGANPMREWAYVDAFSAYRGKPGQYDEGKTVNSYGFISTPELTLEKPDNTIRIVFLGGSSTAGTGVNLPDEATWPWQTAVLLQERFPEYNIEFINGALGGYTSFESYGRLWSRIRFFSPDVVVVNHGWNEMYYFDRIDNMPAWRTSPDGNWDFDQAPAPVTLLEPLPIDSVIRFSQTLTYLRLALASSAAGEAGARRDVPLADTYDRRGIDVWRTNLRLLRDTADLLGAELFVMKQPTLIVPDLPPAERERVRYEYHGFDHEAHLDAYQRIYQTIDEEIAPERIIDVTPLSGRPELFFDHVHPTADGAAEISRLVADALTPYLQTMRERP